MYQNNTQDMMRSGIYDRESIVSQPEQSSGPFLVAEPPKIEVSMPQSKVKPSDHDKEERKESNIKTNQPP